jgi:inositol 1,4,5-triphosphate receptor type 1/inositol 1,4,5-triphosphate receptor type 3
VLKALSNYIIISQDNVDPNAEDDEKDGLLAEEKANHQNFLNSNNAMGITLLLLSDNHDPEQSDLLFNDLISFGIQLLDGGNREV